MELKIRRRWRPPKGETYTRDGRWTRDFAARTEPWPVIEHWAGEHGYHLVATRGTSRRVYVKDGFFDQAQTILDIKATERHLTLTAGIQMTLLVRFLTLFLYPREFVIFPSGWRGVRLRRAACRDLNVLLYRFGKNEIIGSTGFHVADLDLTTLLLAAALVLPFVAFFAFTLGRLQLFPGLSPILLMEMGKYLSILAGTATALLGVHHFVSIRKIESMLWRSIAAFGCLVVFALLTTLLTTKTGQAMTESKFVFHCVYRFNEIPCRQAVSQLSPREREALSSRLEFIEKSLSIKK